MFVIMVYDVHVDRVHRVLKTARKYLNHVQNSVFEGELSPAQLRKLQGDIRNITDAGYDAVRYYVQRSREYLTIEQYGTPRRDTDTFL